MDANLNVAQCLKSVSDFGVNHIHNVCTGTVTDVPWGAVDWTLCFGVGAFAVVMVTMFAIMGLSIARDFLFGW